MFANEGSWVCVGKVCSQEFEVKAWVYQGSVLSPLLFIIVLEAFSHEFCSGVPCEDLYADDLVIIANLLKECAKNCTTPGVLYLTLTYIAKTYINLL